MFLLLVEATDNFERLCPEITVTMLVNFWKSLWKKISCLFLDLTFLHFGERHLEVIFELVKLKTKGSFQIWWYPLVVVLGLTLKWKWWQAVCSMLPSLLSVLWHCQRLLDSHYLSLGSRPIVLGTHIITVSFFTEIHLSKLLHGLSPGLMDSGEIGHCLDVRTYLFLNVLMVC